MATKRKTEYISAGFAPIKDEELERLQNQEQDAKSRLQAASEDLQRYTSQGYSPSERVTAAQNEYDKRYNALKSYGEYKNPNAEAYQAALNAVINRPQFTFSTDGDALYNKYKTTVQNAAKNAYDHAAGQAAQLSGGYGNSYAVTAGAQAMNEQLSRLDDIIPELWQLARDKYDAEGNELLSRYNLLASDDDRGYSRWLSGREIAGDLADRARAYYNDEYSRDYGEWGDRGNLLQTAFGTASTMRQQEIEDALTAAQYGDFAGLRSLGIDTTRAEQEQALDLATKQAALAKAYKSGSGSGSGGGDDDGYTLKRFDDLAKQDKKQLEALAENGDNDKFMAYLEGLMDEGIIDIDSANAICRQFGIDYEETDESTLPTQSKYDPEALGERPIKTWYSNGHKYVKYDSGRTEKIY